MSAQTDGFDEELQQPRRRIGTGLLTAVAVAAVVGGLLVTVGVGDEQRTPDPDRTSSTAAPTPSASVELSGSASAPVEVAVVVPPDALLRAVRAAYPRAQLVEVGIAVPVRADSDRNYQFLAGARRITVVVGPVDVRPEVQTSSERDVLVVAKRSGHRVAVSVRTFRGTLRPTDLGTAQRLARDSRLLATA